MNCSYLSPACNVIVGIIAVVVFLQHSDPILLVVAFGNIGVGLILATQVRARRTARAEDMRRRIDA